MTPYSLPLIAPAHLGTSSWLWRLRWFAVFGQLATILVAVVIARYEVPLYPLLALVAVTAVSNASYGVWLRRAEQSASRSESNTPPDPMAPEMGPLDDLAHVEIAEADKIATSLMMLDLVTLTCMLYLSGGLDNPFSLFYFVNLAVGGVILQPRFSWILAILAIAGAGLLIVLAPKVPGLGADSPSYALRVYHLGLFVAFSTCTLVVTYFVTRTAAVLTWRERQLRETQAHHAQTLRLQGLTTLAAGAAHELATPLSTIDVITRELANHLQGQQIPESVRKDLQLIDHQIDMCKQILRRMRGAAGDSMINQWNHTTVGDLIDCALEGVRDPDRVDVTDGPQELEQQSLWIPQEAVAQAIRNLIHNGLDASPAPHRIRLELEKIESHLEFRIYDHGQGMSDEELRRAGEPFYTTKEPGRGMGLGLFLTRSVVERLGGELRFKSTPGQGTVATVRIPCGQSLRGVTANASQA